MSDKYLQFKSTLILSIIAIVLFCIYLPLQDNLELIAYDKRTLLRSKPADPDIIIVNVDPESISRASELSKLGLGRYPWPRTVWSKIIKDINKQNPKAIVLDVMLQGSNNSDKITDELFEKQLINVPNLFFVQNIFNTRETLKNIVLDTLEKGVKHKNIILETIPNLDDEIEKNIRILETTKLKSGPGSLIDKYSYSVDDQILNNSTKKDILRYYKLNKYLDSIYRIAEGIGLNNVKVDPVDKTIRSLQPIYKYGDKYLLAISLDVYYHLYGNNKPITLTENTLKIGSKSIPLNEELCYYINWRKKTKLTKKDIDNLVIVPERMVHKSVSFIRVFLNENIPPDIFTDKIVIIGIGSEIHVKDIHRVPNEIGFIGPEILATAIDNFINDDSFIIKANIYINIMVSVCLLSLVLLNFYFTKSQKHYLAIMRAFLIIVFYIGVNLILFSYFAFWLDLITPTIICIIAVGFCIAHSFIIERSKRNYIEKSFSRYISPQIFNYLLSNFNEVNLKAQKKKVTLLFSDIRGFTPMVEDLTPEDIAGYINDYFDTMTEIILRNDGTVDKLMGDAIMAFFGDPVNHTDHALKAAKTSLEMIEGLNQLNIKWSNQGKRQLDIGIGINTGLVAIGNFGSKKFMNYTAMGDAVNLASRLETMTKETNTTILISAYTYQEIKDNVNVRIIGAKNIKGKSERIVVYELLDLKE